MKISTRHTVSSFPFAEATQLVTKLVDSSSKRRINKVPPNKVFPMFVLSLAKYVLPLGGDNLTTGTWVNQIVATNFLQIHAHGKKKTKNSASKFLSELGLTTLSEDLLSLFVNKNLY